MFERFTKNARVAVITAQDEARTMQHDSVRDDHVLLAALETPSVAQRIFVGTEADIEVVRDLVRRAGSPEQDAEALRALGIDLDEVRRRAEETFGPGALDRTPRRRRLFGRGLPSSHIPFDRSGKELLQDSLRVALSLRHNYIGTEHMLLSVLGRPESRAAQILRAGGVTLEEEAATDLVLAEIRRPA